MDIIRFVLGKYDTNCYLVKGDGGACVLVDPADDGEGLIHQMRKMGVTPAAVLLTHGHYDHILAVPVLQKRWDNLPVYCHPVDCPKELEEYDMGCVFPTVSAFRNLCGLQDGQELSIAGLTFRVLHTPGHTPGSVTLQVENTLFTGDTLFCGDIGRTDFTGGSDREMMASLRRLASLPGNYSVLSGHGEPTELEQERRFNPYMKQARGGAT